jgi:hypothetical protein
MRARGLDAINARRRTQLAEHLMKKRNLEGTRIPKSMPQSSQVSYSRSTALLVRDISNPYNTTHKSSVSYTAQTDLSTVFAGNNSCVLSPEQIEGPYCKLGRHRHVTRRLNNV